VYTKEIEDNMGRGRERSIREGVEYVGEGGRGDAEI